MFVTASRRYVPNADVLVKEHLYDVDSGMGGSFTVQYKGKVGDRHHFVRLKHNDWPQTDYHFTDAELPASVYITPPESSHYEAEWDAGQARQRRFSTIYNATEGWFPPPNDRPSYGYLQSLGLMPGGEAWAVDETCYWIRSGKVASGPVVNVSATGLLVHVEDGKPRAYVQYQSARHTLDALREYVESKGGVFPA